MLLNFNIFDWQAHQLVNLLGRPKQGIGCTGLRKPALFKAWKGV